MTLASFNSHLKNGLILFYVLQNELIAYFQQTNDSLFLNYCFYFFRTYSGDESTQL